MVPIKIFRKFKVARKVLREQGLLGFLIVCLQFLQKHASHKNSSSGKIKIYTKAEYSQIIKVDPKNPPKPWRGSAKSSYVINWLMPPPGKGSGGHMTLFRFIKFIEDAGHTNRIYFYLPGSDQATVAMVKAVMGDSFPKVKADMQWLRTGQDMQPADAIIATSWETAYVSYNSKVHAKRFYFVQDFEPYFYPVGSLSILAENTYKFGFFGITAGGWLAKKLKEDYGMQTDFFNFGSDNNVYKFENTSKRKEIVFYARPYTERRGFEIGVMALDLFHKKHPEYTINFFGYDTRDYELPFPYNNLDVLEHHEINELYNRCAAGLVMSLTNMSLLPLELLACGTIPVVNDGPNNRLVSNNRYIDYCPTDPVSLAEALSAVVTKKNLPHYASKAAASVKDTDWDESGKKFVSIIEKQLGQK